MVPSKQVPAIQSPLTRVSEAKLKLILLRTEKAILIAKSSIGL